MSNETNGFEEFFLDETSVIELETPHGKPLKHNGEVVRVHVYGPATDKFKKAQEKLQAEATKNIVAAMSKGKKKEDSDKYSDADFLTAITEKFDNFPFPGGAEAIYTEPRLVYINKQVQAFVDDMGNFFGSGQKK